MCKYVQHAHETMLIQELCKVMLDLWQGKKSQKPASCTRAARCVVPFHLFGPRFLLGVEVSAKEGLSEKGPKPDANT